MTVKSLHQEPQGREQTQLPCTTASNRYNHNAVSRMPEGAHMQDVFPISQAGTTSTDQSMMATMTHLLEAQQHMMGAQVLAMAAQSVPPLCKLSGENINTDEGSIE